MLLFQIIFIVFFLINIAKVAVRWYQKELTGGVAALWVIFWIAAGTIVLKPNLTAVAAQHFGIGRGADLVVYVSLAVLFFLVFRLMVWIERLKKQITLLSRKIALDEVKDTHI